MSGSDESIPGDDDTGDEPTFQLDRALESLKRPRSAADEPHVTSDAPTRMNWSSVTEAEPDSEPTPSADPAELAAPVDQSFQFDLGSALARLGGPRTEPDVPAAGRVPDARPTTPVAPPHPDGTDSIAPAHPQRAAVPAPPLTVDEDELTSPAPGVSTSVEQPVVAELPQRSPVEQVAPTDPLPQRSPVEQVGPADPLPQRSPVEQPGVAELPRRHAAPPPPPEQPYRPSPASVSDAGVVSAEALHRGPNTPQTSVFADSAPAPSLPAEPRRHPMVEPSAPVIPAGAIANLPTLPAAVPPAPSPVAEPSNAPATPDIHAVRSFQLKAKREQRRGKVVGRTLLVVFLLGGAVAAALTFGRSYLFPTEWDSALIPIVNQIQDDRDGSFVDAVELEILPAEEYAPIVLELTVGDGWTERLPEWRALGVAVGDSDVAGLADTVAAWRPAIYDPVTDRVLQVADGDPDATTAALTLALEEVYERQHGTAPNDTFDGTALGVLGVSPLEQINSSAIDRTLLGGSTEFTAAAESQVPLPLLYEFTAIDALGEPLVASAPSTTFNYGGDHPDSVLTATDVSHDLATAAVVPEGVETVGEPVALGLDNWAMIWTNRLPVRTVERLQTLISADSYQPLQRGEARCFVASMQATSETAAADLLGNMTQWVSNGPPEAGATATLAEPTRIELFACDPGPDAGYVIDNSAVSAVIASQVARL